MTQLKTLFEFKDKISKIVSISRLNDKVAVISILLLSLFAFLPGFFTTPPIDREETRYVLVSKQMLDSGNILDVNSIDLPDHEKPIGLYWLQVALMKFSGFELPGPIWIYRIPSLLGAFLTVLSIYWCARTFIVPGPAFLAAILVAVSLLVGIEARLAKYDSLNLACIVTAQGALARIWLTYDDRSPSRLAILFWVSFSGSFLIGGSTGPLVLLLTVLCICLSTRNFRWTVKLHLTMGIVLSLSLMLPPLVAINYKFDGNLFTFSIIKDLFGKVAYGLETKGPPPLTHFAIMQLTFWPLSVFAILAIPKIFKNFRNPVMIFLLSWIVPYWTVLELVAFKHPSLVLPILPALSVASVISLMPEETIWKAGRRIGVLLLLFVPITLTALIVAIPIVARDEISLVGLLLCTFGILVSLYATLQIWNSKHLLEAILPTALAAILIYAGIWGWSLPSVSSMWISPRINEKIMEVISCPNPTTNVIGFKEPSIEFFTKNVIRNNSVENIDKILVKYDCNVIIIEEKKLDDLEVLEFIHKHKLISKAVVSGFNYSTGKHVNLHIFEL